MADNWGERVKRYRMRHGLSQERLAVMLGVAQRTVSRWERGEDKPGLDQQRQLRDLAWEPSGTLLDSIAHAVVRCPAPRALSRTRNLRLQVLSRPAIDKRPSVTEWIGRDLVGIACGVLAEMLDDRPLQAGIANGDITCVVATTRSVLQTAEHPTIGTYRTTIGYFFHEGTLYSDAISVPAPPDTSLGYTAIAMDEAVDWRL
jgi:transcriptional regulator with XRE-family HTH domain